MTLQGWQQRGGGRAELWPKGPNPSLTDVAWLLAFSAAASANN